MNKKEQGKAGSAGLVKREQRKAGGPEMDRGKQGKTGILGLDKTEEGKAGDHGLDKYVQERQVATWSTRGSRKMQMAMGWSKRSRGRQTTMA